MPNFDVQKFEDLIGDPAQGGRGRPFQWEVAQRCPCFDLRSRSPKEDCPRCHGFSYFYTPQVPPEGVESFFGGALSIMGDRRYAKFGEWLVGDLALTFSGEGPESLIKDMDRITLVDDFYPQSDVLIRGSNDRLIDRGAFEVLTASDETQDYTPGLDFSLVDGEVVWTGQRPADGATYSVNYKAHGVFVVWLQLPQDRTRVPSAMSDGTVANRAMPRKVALRRWIDFTRDQEERN